jgi:hypothetical protein
MLLSPIFKCYVVTFIPIFNVPEWLIRYALIRGSTTIFETQYVIENINFLAHGTLAGLLNVSFPGQVWIGKRYDAPFVNQ